MSRIFAPASRPSTEINYQYCMHGQHFYIEVIPATMSTESESASSRGGPATKKPKRVSKWQHEWKRYNMSESRKGSSYVHCDICGTDFSIAGGGSHEVKRHVEGRRHIE